MSRVQIGPAPTVAVLPTRRALPRQIALGWTVATVEQLYALRLHFDAHRLARPFTFTPPGWGQRVACVYESGPAIRTRARYGTAQIVVREIY